MVSVPNKFKDLGIVYTPASLVEYLTRRTIHGYLIWNLKQSLGNDYINKKIFLNIADVPETEIPRLLRLIKDVTILDPSVGSGFFLKRALNVLLEIYSDLIRLEVQKGPLLKKKVEIISNNLYGVDISRTAVNKCKENLLKEARNDLSENKIKNLESILNVRIRRGNAIIGDSFNLINQQNLNKDFLDFNWNIEFPEILESGGFAVCIANPPWNILKSFEKEFFSKYDSRITKYGVTKQEARKIIAGLRENEEIQSNWMKYCRSIKEQSKYFRTYYKYQTGEISSGKKSRTVSGDINLYKIFLERSFSLLKKNGVGGFLVPSGFHSDAGTRGLRTLFLEKNTFIELIGFENKRGIFPSIHKSFKFDSIVLVKNLQKTIDFSTCFMQTEVKGLDKERKSILNTSWSKIKEYSPSSWSIIEFKNNNDQKLVEKLYKFPIISDLDQARFVLKFKREVDITLDSQLFNSATDGYPVFEGKMIEQFTHQFKKPRFWISAENYKSKFKKNNTLINDFKLVFRAVAASTNRRTMISTLLPPKTCCGNSLIIVDSFPENKKEKLSISDKIFLSGIFNSFIFDYLLRLKVSQNLNMFIMQDMPLPRVTPQDSIYNRMVSLAMSLYLKYPEFKRLKGNFPLNKISQEENSYEKIRAELDALVAKIYKLEYEDFEYILKQFHVHETRSKKLLNSHKNRALEIFKKIENSYR